MGVDYIDESEVLTPADEEFHLLKSDYTVPFVCGCRDLGEAARRIGEGASMLRTKGEPGTGNIVEAVRHIRVVNAQVRRVVGMSADELMTESKNLGAPYELLLEIKRLGRLPVVNFAAATTNYKDYKLIAEISKELGTPMKGIDIATLNVNERMQERGW
ncbi:hypothetical protein RhiirA1_433022 [Rhizophagus irregularis]|uniref:pyridoxal 5'-phosphate synthase (glutamine hydrolyzing) n=1 Tax=Rhizophagus irregularis TaxID=588596 RepID=A0A2N0QK96_9GLOM|nr:hypothetical protein RhiirA1_433022 [Rhizophagus irregularis]